MSSSNTSDSSSSKTLSSDASDVASAGSSSVSSTGSSATSATSGVDGKFWEFLDYIYPTNHTWGSNAVTINLDTWNKLSADDQAAIEQVAADLEPSFWNVSRQGDLDSIATMGENGMKLVPLSDELLGDIAEKAATVQANFFERVPEALPIVEAYKASK